MKCSKLMKEALERYKELDNFLENYVMSSKEINQALYSNDKELHKIVEQNLERLPKYKGFVYRGTALTNEQFSKLKPGGRFKLNFIGSTSKDKGMAEDFIIDRGLTNNDNPVLFKILDSRGDGLRDITEFSDFEDEVLLKPSQALEVFSIEPYNFNYTPKEYKYKTIDEAILRYRLSDSFRRQRDAGILDDEDIIRMFKTQYNKYHNTKLIYLKTIKGAVPALGVIGLMTSINKQKTETR